MMSYCSILLYWAIPFLIPTDPMVEEETLFFDGSYEEACVNAQTTGKHLLLDFYTVWCGGCQYQDKYIFTMQSFKDFIQKGFIALKIDAEKKENVPLVRNFGISGYPTLLVTDSHGNELGRIVGGSDSTHALIQKIENILSGVGTLVDFERQLKEHPNDLHIIETLLKKYQEKKQYARVKQLAQQMTSIAVDSEAKNKGKVYYAIASLYDTNRPNPEPLMRLTSEHSALGDDLRMQCYTTLLWHFVRKEDQAKIDYFYSRIIELNPDDHYFKKEYARFLFQSDKRIELAITLAKEYAAIPEFRDDHWVPYLLAYEHAYRNELNRGMELYDAWMDEYANQWDMPDSYWPFVFYSRFSLDQNVRLKNGLKYAEKAEAYSRSFFDKVRLAELLIRCEDKEVAVAKLEEALTVARTSKEYRTATEMLERLRRE